MENTKETTQGKLIVGNQVIASDITYGEYLANYADRPIGWVGEIPDDFLFEGEVIATNVSYEGFLKNFSDQHVEWIDGNVIQMSPSTPPHNQLLIFLASLLRNYVGFIGGGEIFVDSVVIRSEKQRRGRAPDVAVVLPHNYGIIKDNDISGAPDLVIEIVSPDSHRRDRVEKFTEYERLGVPEYWIIDPIRKETLFYILGNDKKYKSIEPDENGLYHSTVLDKLKIAVEIFWREKLPDGVETFRMVEALFSEESE
jgi:Uma2 family endonuclease